jgi:hypothetical protein
MNVLRLMPVTAAGGKAEASVLDASAEELGGFALDGYSERLPARYPEMG